MLNIDLINIICIFKDVKETQEQLDGLKIPQEEMVASYYFIREQLAALTTTFTGFMVQPQYLLPFLQPGRLIRIKDFDWGMIVNFRKVGGEDRRDRNPLKKPQETKIIVDVLVHQVS